MANPKIAFSLRLDNYRHDYLRNLSLQNNESITATIERAIDLMIEQTTTTKFIKTDREAFSIRITTDCRGWSDMTLCSAYAGSEHVTIVNVNPDYFEETVEKLKSMVEFIDNTII